MLGPGSEARYIEVSAAVRYWEDATVNGIVDSTGGLIPFKQGDLWCPVIRLADGWFVDWPAGTEAQVYYKVCDAGVYWLLDENRRRVGKWQRSYVPDKFLCHGDVGLGDYIILNVASTGVVEGWQPPEVVWAPDAKTAGWALQT